MIHPKLAGEDRANRWVGMPLMALFASSIAVVAALALRGGYPPFEALVFAVPMTLLFTWAAWYAWSRSARYKRATWVLDHTAPVRVAVFFATNVENWPVARLRPHNRGAGEWINEMPQRAAELSFSRGYGRASPHRSLARRPDRARDLAGANLVASGYAQRARHIAAPAAVRQGTIFS